MLENMTDRESNMLKVLLVVFAACAILLCGAYYTLDSCKLSTQILTSENNRLMMYNNEYEIVNENLTLINQNLTDQLVDVAKKSNTYKSIADEFTSELINTKCLNTESDFVKISKSYAVDCDLFHRTNGTYVIKVNIDDKKQ